jgi:hypothetical protein
MSDDTCLFYAIYYSMRHDHHDHLAKLLIHAICNFVQEDYNPGVAHLSTKNVYDSMAHF